MIKVTQSAWNRIESSFENKALRVGIESGGCHGFQYVYQKGSFNEEDDFLISHNHAQVIIQKKYLPFLKGGELDFKEELMHSHFVFTNPNIEQGCGCGVSFQIPKVEK